MRPDIKINGISMASLGWLRETVSFPTPKAQSNTIVVPGRNTPIRYTEALGRVSFEPRTFNMVFCVEEKNRSWCSSSNANDQRAVTALLKQNIESTVFGDLEDRLTMVDKKLADLQTQMIAVSGDEVAVDSLGEQINVLREERQSILAEAAKRSDLQERMNDMISFLDEMPQAITEYSDTITRRQVEKITIFDEKIVVELKSGLQMEVEA